MTMTKVPKQQREQLVSHRVNIFYFFLTLFYIILYSHLYCYDEYSVFPGPNAYTVYNIIIIHVYICIKIMHIIYNNIGVKKM